MCHIKKKPEVSRSSTPPDSSVAPTPSPGSQAQVPTSSITDNKATKTADDGWPDPLRGKKGGKKKKSFDEMKQAIEEAQRAMGRKPNSTIIDRMVQREKDKEKMDKSDSVKSRKGDIAFNLKGVLKDIKQKMEKSPDDDTLYPEKSSPTTSKPKAKPKMENLNKEPSLDDEELVEDERETLDEDNWMRHDEHIYRTCHDNIRELERGAHTYFMQKLNSMDTITEWDRFAPIEVLENRDLFTSSVLEVYTFISATETMDDKEKVRIPVKKKQKYAKKPTFREQIIDLTSLHPVDIELRNPISENSCTINNTPESSTLPSRGSRLKDRNTITSPNVTSVAVKSKVTPLLVEM